MEDARRVLRETEGPDRIGIVTLITEAVLVLAVGFFWWFVLGTALMKSGWFPWVAITIPVVSIGLPLVWTVKNRRRKANMQTQPITENPGSG